MHTAFIDFYMRTGTVIKTSDVREFPCETQAEQSRHADTFLKL